ncbi:nucleotidyltransferase domain-containing protein [Candidatus Pacearchaeota archaeon]|nr:nucleotidyltransferase domain-containing protein [Candidatus Pacearchaeota archaeon]
MEIIKNAVKVGNSAGVLLPKKWLNLQVKVIVGPLNIEMEVFEILLKENYLKQILGVYIVGSYARNEQTIDSDVDILVITDNINKKIKKGRYEIMLVSKKSLENSIRKNIFPIIPMLVEAKTIINEGIRKKYMNIEMNSRNLRFHIETTNSAMNVVNAEISLAKELREKGISDNIVYSLVLRLRTLYIIDCLRKNKIWSKKEFLELIKKIGGSTLAYEGYLRSKNNKKEMSELGIEEAIKLMNYIKKKNKETEKWLREKKD